METPPSSYPSSSISEDSNFKRKRTVNDQEVQHQHSQTVSNQNRNSLPFKQGIQSVLSDVTNVIPSVRTETRQSGMTPILQRSTQNTRFLSASKPNGTKTCGQVKGKSCAPAKRLRTNDSSYCKF